MMETPKILALSGLPGFGADEALYLDPPCNGTQARLHYSPLLDSEHWQAAKRSADRSYNTLMPLLADWFDAYHRESLERKYWEQVAGWFLLSLVEIVTAKCVILEDVRANWPDLPVIGMSVERFARPDSVRSFVGAMRDCPASNLQLATQVAMAMDFSVETRDDSELSPFAKRDCDGASASPPKFKLWPRSPRADIWLYKTVMRRRTIGLLSLATGLRTADLKMETRAANHKPDPEARADLAAQPVNTDRERVLLKILAQLLPTDYLEGWRALSETAQEWIGQRRPNVIVTGLGSFWSPQFAVWCAECRSLGTRVVGLQHGGCYGERDYCSYETHERRISDCYVTWGWSENRSTIPLPAARLAGIPVQPGVPGGHILWVGTADARQVYQIGPRPVGPQFEAYFDEQRRFADALAPGVAQQVLFRPYPVDFGWPDQPGLGESFPVAVDDLSKGYWEQLRACRMVVVDHVGSTTLLEALAAGRPVMVFGGNELYDIRASARPYYEALARVGVYHKSAESAAAELARMAHDVEDWWANPERVRAVASFRKRFADSKKFLRSWRSFLLNYRLSAKHGRIRP